jgi:hypothetical protein
MFLTCFQNGRQKGSKKEAVPIQERKTEQADIVRICQSGL